MAPASATPRPRDQGGVSETRRLGVMIVRMTAPVEGKEERRQASSDITRRRQPIRSAPGPDEENPTVATIRADKDPP